MGRIFLILLDEKYRRMRVEKKIVNAILQNMKYAFMGWENCDTMEKNKI